MKLGIGTYTYMWSIGFPGAEPAELDEILAACSELGLELEVGTRGVSREHLRRLIDFTERCGSSLLRTVADNDGNLTELLRAVEPDLRRARVRLGVENSLMPAAALASALDAVNSEYVGVTLDTVNSLAIPEGTEEVAGTLARRTCCLHVKDFEVKREWHMMGFRVQGRPAGQGRLNVPRLLETLRSAGARCNAILELWPPEQASLRETIALEQRWAEESITYLRTLIKE